MEKNAEAYIQFTLLKAAANVALQQAAEQAFKAELELNKTDKESSSYILSGLPNSSLSDMKGLYHKAAEQNRKTAADEFKKDENLLTKVSDDLFKKASDIAKKYHFDFLPDAKDKKSPENVFAQRLQALKARLHPLQTPPSARMILSALRLQRRSKAIRWK